MVTFPQYTLNGSSPERYAEDFQKQLDAIRVLHKSMSTADYPHGRDFQLGERSLQMSRQARYEHNKRLAIVVQLGIEIEQLLEDAVNARDAKLQSGAIIP